MGTKNVPVLEAQAPSVVSDAMQCRLYAAVYSLKSRGHLIATFYARLIPPRKNGVSVVKRCCMRVLPAIGACICLLSPLNASAWLPLSSSLLRLHAAPLRFSALCFSPDETAKESKLRRKPRKGTEKAMEVEAVASMTGPQSPLVRVCLLRYAGASQITVSVLPGAHLRDAQGRELAAGTGPWTFRAGTNTVSVSGASGRHTGAALSAVCWRVQAEDGDTQIGIKGTGSSTRHYRGSLEIRSAGGELRLINEVGMEPYLQGVVISEIGEGPLEALKAQTIAARTYAISSRGRWKADGYDLRDSVDSQAYGGIEAESADGNRAVQETRGQILTVRGQAIDADFCDDCGGVTAPGDDPNILPLSVSDDIAHRYARHAPYGVWTLALSSARLKALTAKNAKARGQGDLQNVEIVQRDVSGRAARVRFTWHIGTPAVPSATPAVPVPSSEDTKGDVTAQRGALPSRHAVLKRSLRAQTSVSYHSGTQSTSQNNADSSHTTAPYGSNGQGQAAKDSGSPADVVTTTEISGDALRAMIGYNVLRSTLITIRRTANGDFVFDGRGWGHGHGLCQQGALALAAPPLRQNCKTILAHYYPGALLGAWALYDEEGAQK